MNQDHNIYFPRGCAFCTRLAKIDRATLGDNAFESAVDELFDLADRAARARRLYGQRKGHR